MPKMKVWNGTTWITLDANNADTVDGKHASDFAPSSHVGSGGSAHAVATPSVDGFMSASDKSKLDGIQAGAEVNQNAFSNVKIGNTTITADSKTDTLELVAGANITLTPDEVNDKVTISATVPVTSVNGRTGAVSLTASDVGASPAGHTHAFTDITGKPSTLAGYGITDAVNKSGDTMTGCLQFGAGQDIAADAVSGTTPMQGIRFIADTDIFDLFLRTDNVGEKSGLILALGDNFDDYFQIEQVSPAGETSPTVLFKISESTGANFTTTLKVNGNIVWHAGNNGAGSGLDADMVDGKHFSDIQADAQARANKAEANARAYTEARANQAEANARAYTEARANQAEANARAYTDSAPEAMQMNIGRLLVYKSGKDSNGIFTVVEYKRTNGTLYARSVLSGGKSPQYTTRTVTYYSTNGTTVVRTDTWRLSYDENGDLISEVM